MVSCTLAVQFSVKVLYGGVTKAVTVCGCTLTSTTGPVGEKQEGLNYYSTHLKQKWCKRTNNKLPQIPETQILGPKTFNDYNLHSWPR